MANAVFSAPSDSIDERKRRAKAWFTQLQIEIIAALEELETEADTKLYGAKTGRFVFTPWKRTDHEAHQSRIYPRLAI